VKYSDDMTEADLAAQELETEADLYRYWGP
jgi:hypothetical protein